MSKGSNRRPTQVPYEVWESNWEKAFGRIRDKSKRNTEVQDRLRNKPTEEDQDATNSLSVSD